MITGCAVSKYFVGGRSTVFLDSDFQPSAGFSYISRTAVFNGAGPLEHHIPVQLCWDFVLGVN